MLIVTIELVGSHGGTLDSTVVRVPEGQEDGGAAQINAAVQAFVSQLILNPGDSIRISEYQ
jgi:hypothetical protein